jgi:hypothetical protein
MKSIFIIIILRIFPKTPSYIDTAIYLRIKSLDWITYDHLEINKFNRVDEMWALASKSIENLIFIELN